jgi:hypothetical protein
MAYSEDMVQSMIQAQDDFVWETPSHEYRHRGPHWYVYMSLIAIALVIYAVATGNFLFAFIILMAAIIIVLAGHEEPYAVLVQIGKNGVVLDGKLYEFKHLDDFAIIYHPPQTKVLYFEGKKLHQPRLRIDLVNENPIEIRDHLKLYLPENVVLQDEHASDILARLLKI